MAALLAFAAAKCKNEPVKKTSVKSETIESEIAENNLTKESVKELVKTDLVYKVREARPGAKKPPLLILLHGLGSNEDDLFQLAGHIDKDYLVVFVRAPYSAGQNRYKWYDVSFGGGKPTINEAQAQESLGTLAAFTEQLKSTLSFDEDRVTIGGFSQGAIMSYSFALQNPSKVQGVLALSGRLLESAKSTADSEEFKNISVLIVHGTSDRVLPVHYARTAKEFLDSKGFKMDYHELNMGHSINGETIQFMNQQLSKLKGE